ncbi:MAG: cell envelope biogenesis protein OmpA [Flavobacteriaceae bacterium]|nr:cell envelope biogenesis protein OmpA [Muriicola sp.]NNC61073.1 cell envelope biogenesis protein OmpA [Eudoraea sp.]NNK21529.1 cell envelope biogenesis protein OmpA [Flavobacteriaceae bacterium]MBT8289495.1 cell envelope biogenesis protein OmpA [Muriicola sp.]NNK34687.1 cell envelope biogenesis protein OmpA [Eudoraea sp.]
MDEQAKLEILKDILFPDDRGAVQDIAKRIELVELIVNDQKELAARVDPLVDEKINAFTKSIPDTLGPTITATLKKEIKNHKDEVVDALYPVLGKMVKKYVAQEIKILSEKIDNQLGFIKRFKRKMRSWFGGPTEEQLLMRELSSATIEQVLLIERDTGILKASYSVTNSIDEEMISGMLTAIKSFVEDAFQKKNQNLELIQYELYNIHLQSFVTHYVAVVISGDYHLTSKNKLQDIIFNFYYNFMAMNLDLVFKSKEQKKEGKAVRTIDKDLLEKELEASFGNAKI